MPDSAQSYEQPAAQIASGDQEIEHPFAVAKDPIIPADRVPAGDAWPPGSGAGDRRALALALMGFRRHAGVFRFLLFMATRERPRPDTRTRDIP